MKKHDWAERAVNKVMTGYGWDARKRKSVVILPAQAAALLRAHHRRVMRMVQRLRRSKQSSVHLDDVITVTVCETLLASLEEMEQ
jgi:hypothetical protein